jgi:hypothetical protein
MTEAVRKTHHHKGPPIAKFIQPARRRRTIWGVALFLGPAQA